MFIKNIIKKNKYISNCLRNLKFKKKYDSDKKYFIENYMLSYGYTDNKLSYNISLIVHSIEKGLGNAKPRLFGLNKIKELINLTENLENKNCYSYFLAISCLYNYKKFLELNSFTNEHIYSYVTDYLYNKKLDENYSVGKVEFFYNNIKEDSNIDFLSFAKSRHSIRKFSNKKLALKDLEYAVNSALLAPSACNRQFCKVYFVENKRLVKLCINSSRGISGFDEDNLKFAIITYDVNGLINIDERNQGMFNAGLFSMNLVNGLHVRGIGSCFIQFSNDLKEEKKLKEALSIPFNEKIAVFIAIGYYPEIVSSLHSSRKNIKDIYNIK